MKTKTIELYTLQELKDSYPEAFERVHQRWKEQVSSRGSDWTEETMDSLRAVCESLGARIIDYSIGPWGYSNLDVSIRIDEEDDEGNPIDPKVLALEQLRKIGYVDAGKDEPTFDGRCELTGYCADDNFLEAFWQAIQTGDTYKEAIEGLASDASRMMEDDIEQQQEEESMFANWEHLWFTSEGDEE